MTKSHIPYVNTPQSISINAPQFQNNGRPIGEKDKNPWKTKSNKKTLSLLEPLEEDRHEEDNPSTCAPAPNNHNTGIAERLDQNIFGNYEDLVDAIIEVSMNFVNTRKRYNRNIIVLQRNFSSITALTISNDNLDPEPKSIAECRKHSNWVRWKQAIEVELESLNKRKVFCSVIRTPQNVITIGYKCLFIRKRNENNEVVKHKARLVAQGFS